MNVNIAKIKKKRDGNRETVIHSGSHTSERKLPWKRMKTMEINLKSKKKINGENLRVTDSLS
jgi:hypothetical protein